MNFSRRSFLKSGALAVATFAAFSRFTSLARAADTSLPLAKETEEPAKSLKFCPNADKPSKNCAARKAKDKKDQYCYNCQLFTRLNGDKKDGAGKCMVIPGKSVSAISWCQSWVKNPAMPG